MTEPQKYTLWREEGVEYVYPDGYDPESLTELPSGFFDCPMVPDLVTRTFSIDLAEVKRRKWVEAKAKRDAVMYGGCETPLGRMDTDAESQAKVTGATVMAKLALDNTPTGETCTFSVDWTMADNSVATHDAPTMISAGLAVGGFVSSCHSVGQGLRAAIDAAATVAEIDAIDIEAAAWPTQTPPEPVQ